MLNDVEVSHYLYTKWHRDASSRLARIEMGRKFGRGCTPFVGRGAGSGSPSNTESPGLRPTPCQVASWSIQPFGYNKHGPKINNNCIQYNITLMKLFLPRDVVLARYICYGAESVRLSVRQPQAGILYQNSYTYRITKQRNRITQDSSLLLPKISGNFEWRHHQRQIQVG